MTIPDRPNRTRPRRRTPGSSTLTLGARGEQLAADHLRADGLDIVERNWRCRWGEIDIVASEPVAGSPRRRLVFCEVKTRSGRGYGSPLEAVTFAKMQRLRRLAGHWLDAQGGRETRVEWAGIRIDAIGVLLDGRPGGDDDTAEINHVRGVG